MNEARRQYATELACAHGHFGGDPGGICCSICRPLLEVWDAEHPEAAEDDSADPARDSVPVGKRRRRSRRGNSNISDEAFAALSGGSAEFHALALALGAVTPDSDAPIVWPKKIL